MFGINVDSERFDRAGKPEVILAEGKTIEEIVYSTKELLNKCGRVMITRVYEEAFNAIRDEFRDFVVIENRRAKVCAVFKKGEYEKWEKQLSKRDVDVVILSAGTSDIPVAEEASFTAEFLGMKVEKFYDVGVAGLHRLKKPIECIRSSKAVAVIVVAGMEGALPSVVAGLVDKPVIAVPTSNGYGVALKGFTALFSMLLSCPSGVAVVNIDNGFGAAVFAYTIWRVREDALNRYREEI